MCADKKVWLNIAYDFRCLKGECVQLRACNEHDLKINYVFNQLKCKIRTHVAHFSHITHWTTHYWPCTQRSERTAFSLFKKKLSYTQHLLITATKPSVERRTFNSLCSFKGLMTVLIFRAVFCYFSVWSSKEATTNGIYINKKKTFY